MVKRVFNATGAPYAPFEIIEPSPEIETKQSIKDNAYSHHVTSTCRMGPKDDPDYCVDPDFNVNGVEGLRVVDASVFPRTPGAFPVVPVFMISQKASHVILDGLSEKRWHIFHFVVIILLSFFHRPPVPAGWHHRPARRTSWHARSRPSRHRPLEFERLGID